MTAITEGTVGVSIAAGHLTPTDLPPTRFGKQIMMGDSGNFMIHITPEVARQWIGALEPIAKDNN